MENTLSQNQVQMLAKVERDMDAGILPFVYVDGGKERMTILPECMEYFGIEQGQNINMGIVVEVLKWNIANCKAQIALRDAQEKASSQ